jgi:signal transduction histidine kinase
VLAAAAAAPLAVAAGVAVSPLGGTAFVPLLIAGGVGTAVVAVAAWAVIARLSALAEWGRRLTAGDLPSEPAGRDELAGVVTAALAVELNRRQNLLAFRRVLGEATAGVQQLADGTTVSPPKESGLCTAEAKGLAAAFHDAGKKLGALRQRLALTAKAILELPAAVVAADDAGTIRYANAAFKRLIGCPTATLARQPLRALLDATAADPAGRPTLQPDELAAWLAAGASGERVAELQVAGGSVVRAAVTANKIDGTWYLVARDLTAEYDRLAQDRGRTREDCFRAAWGMTARAESEPLDAIQAAVRLLTADAKQSNGREAMLPRLALARQHVGELDAHVRILRWLYQSLWGQLPPPLVGEFRAAEPARAAVDQLTPRFKARNVTVTVSDDGGWMCGDGEWIRTALIGVLAHAAGAARDGTVGIRLRRLPPLPGAADERACFEVVDAGSPLDPLQLTELIAPFGGLQVPSYLDPLADGFLPGLVLAAELVRRMGGEWELDATPSGGLIVRFTVPTRVAGGATTVAAPLAAGESAPVEELVMGWKLGTA